MRPDGIVAFLPPLAQHLLLLERIEDFKVQQFVPQLSVERLDIPFFPRAARHDVQCLDFKRLQPLLKQRYGPVSGVNVSPGW